MAALETEAVDRPSVGQLATAAGVTERTLARAFRDTFGTTIVVVSHELASIFALADRAVMLAREEQGIIAAGPPAALVDSPDPRVRAFLTRTAPA
jgi:phospholipid/cholesterol/gamma-HCH transport system ATP-binding protein